MNGLRIYSQPTFPFFSDFFNDNQRIFHGEVSKFNASTNIEEKDNHYLVSLEAPGFNKGDLEIEYKEGVLTVSGSDTRKKDSDHDNVLLMERTSRSFKRSFRLPEIENEKVEASYDNGILTILLPKKEAAKPKKIKIGESEKFFKKMG